MRKMLKIVRIRVPATALRRRRAHALSYPLRMRYGPRTTATFIEASRRGKTDAITRQINHSKKGSSLYR